jgi:hypothetical protein
MVKIVSFSLASGAQRENAGTGFDLSWQRIILGSGETQAPPRFRLHIEKAIVDLLFREARDLQHRTLHEVDRQCHANEPSHH